MDKANFYDHSCDNSVYQFWMDKGYFESQVDSTREPFTIIQPPPNETGNLHIGHAVNNTMQDILIRYHKLSGKNTCWIPGIDHGGISTQVVVDKMLRTAGSKQQKISDDMLLAAIDKFTSEKKGIIRKQLEKLGCGCDWARSRYTLDDVASDQVKIFFKTLFDENLIYKAKYIVNWCTRCCTALSNEEVKQIKHKGSMYHIKYKFTDSDSYVVVATTRPETIFGDVAIAFNPQDTRYIHLENREVLVPIIERAIKLIPDASVDPNFGTGLVKITPSHSQIDYEIAQRHNLPLCTIMDSKGKICNTCTELDARDRFEARRLMVNQLKSRFLLEAVVPHENTIGTCYRCDTIIEPYLSDQWFVKMDSLRELTIKYMDSIIFHEGHHKAILFEWFSKKVNWCISRNLIFGHSIPMWKCSNCNKYTCIITNDIKCDHCRSDNMVREPYVLDTWFSSGLWCYSVFRNDSELEYYFPSNVLITGSDILFFWVARMIMSAAKMHSSIPFREVYLHGVVRDASGDKMSKSKGNSIDPLDLIEKYGADTVRFTLCYFTPKGLDVKLSEKSFDSGKQFCKKLWNTMKYIMINIPDYTSHQSVAPATSIFDRYIQSEFTKVINDYHTSITEYDFRKTLTLLLNFTKNIFCNEYLEYVKNQLDNNTTKYVLLNIYHQLLILLHPFIPFITENIWSELYKSNADGKASILEESMPEKLLDSTVLSPNEELCMAGLKSIVEKIRFVKNKHHIGYKNYSLTPIICTNNTVVMEFLVQHKLWLANHVKLFDLVLLPKDLDDSAAYEFYLLDNNITIFFSLDEFQ